MPEDILQSLSGSKDQLAQASEIAKGVASGALPTAEAFKIPDQVAAAQQALEGLPPGPNFDAAKDAMGNATKAADALKDELAQKLPEPVSQGKDALTGLGQEVKASGGGITAVSGMLPEVKLPISDASKSLGDLKSKVPSAESLQSKIPDVQAKLAPLQEKIKQLAESKQMSRVPARLKILLPVQRELPLPGPYIPTTQELGHQYTRRTCSRLVRWCRDRAASHGGYNFLVVGAILVCAVVLFTTTKSAGSMGVNGVFGGGGWLRCWRSWSSWRL